MSSRNAARSSNFKIGDHVVHRLGFGAMRLTGPGIWGAPRDQEEALRTLRGAVELGVSFIDTADSYGPFVSESLVQSALYPYRGLLIATKGGLTRLGPDRWQPLGRPEYLRQCVLMSLRRLRLERIELWQLHRIDPKTPRDEQFEVMRDMQREGLIANLGLSEVGPQDIRDAQKYFKVATIQNRYNLLDRASEPALAICEREGIGFIPWFPLAAGELTQATPVIERIARELDVATGQLALAWLLRKSPVMLPIPGTSRLDHLRENVAAASLRLSERDFATLDALAPAR